MISAFFLLGSITLLLGILAAYGSPSGQRWTVFGTVIGGIGTALALGIGIWNFYRSAELQREVTAVTLYREHLDLSIDEPLLARASCLSEDPEQASQLREKYAWFVTHGLHSFESILEATEYAEDDDREEWNTTIEEFIEVHRCYFDSRDFKRVHYDESLTAIIDSVLKRAPTEANLPWRNEALQGSCISSHEAMRKQGSWCLGFKGP